MGTIKETLYSPVQADGKRYPIHFKSEGGQIVLSGIESFPDLDISEADTALSAIEKLAKNCNSGGIVQINAGILATSVTIPTTGWIEQKVGDYSYYADIANESITEEMMPELIFAAEGCEIARKYGIGESCETLDGKLRIYSIKIPEVEIPAALCLFRDSSNENSLPLATTTRAGVVKVGDNIDVTDDGTISVPKLSDKDGNGITDVIDDNVATDEEVKKALDEIGL